MSLDNADLAENFVRRFDDLRSRGVEISGVIADVLTNLIDETPALAVMYIIGRGAMNDPRTFAEKIMKVFGYATKIVFEELIAECEKYPPYLTVRA